MQDTAPIHRASRDQLKKVARGFVVCSLLLAAGLLVRRDEVVLTLEMSSQAASMAQVFYDTGSGFREIESRTWPVRVTGDDFQKLTFQLPKGVRRLRFDPATTAGRFIVRNVQLAGPGGVSRVPLSRLVAFNQIATRVEKGSEVVFNTLPAANDAGILIAGDLAPELKIMQGQGHALRVFLLCLPLLAVGAVLVLLAWRQLASGKVGARTLLRIHSLFTRWAERVSLPEFIQFDAYAIWFYAACLVCFLAGSSADLNGSSEGMFSSIYGHGAKDQSLVGAPRAVRVDEWAYQTPSMLNQSLRKDRFEAKESGVGGHFAALVANTPVWHISTLFRPQLWPFFLLRVDYAYAFNWQCKALLMVTGVFTWLLLMTQSTRWAAVGSLWYFFSPFTQWSYSWPSALPEMIGSICFAAVLACFLSVGRNVAALSLAAAGLALCCINFAMCAYPPHLVPLFWLAIFFVAGWCHAHREEVLRREGAGQRVAALLAVTVIVGGVGAWVYSDLRVAITGIGNTAYPGKRVYSGGVYPFYAMTSHFLLWTEREDHFPAALTNVCEGSGFLWFAPVTWLCLRGMRMSRSQKFCWISMWAVFCLLLAWLLLPLPAWLGSPFGLQETAGARLLPALGLANVAIVSLCLASLQKQSALGGGKEWRSLAAAFVIAAAAMLWMLRVTDARLGFFFGRTEVLFAALAAGWLIALLVSGRKSAFALWLILPQAVVFGAVNPLERGLPVLLSSDLITFMRQHPKARDGKWMVISDSVVSSGFFSAMGCNVYTGARYLPDIDYFRVYAAEGYDVQLLNRDGYLTAHLRREDEPKRLELPSVYAVQLDVLPSDPIVKALGIQYVALDQPVAPSARPELTALTPGAVDGFWLYRLR